MMNENNDKFWSLNANCRSCCKTRQNDVPSPLPSPQGRGSSCWRGTSHTTASEGLQKVVGCVYTHRRAAFTLAEVLVTLSILGVVASILVPNIIQQYQKRLNITKLQKAYATLEQAANNIAVNTGCFGKTLECTGLLDYSEEDSRNKKDFSNKFFELSNISIKKKYSFNARVYKAINYDTLSGNNALRQIFNAYVDKNNIGYNVSIISIYLNPSSTTKDITKGLIITIFTDPKLDKISKEESGTRYIFDNIKEGYNVFQFLMYDNFIIEPNAGCWGGQKRPLSKSAEQPGTTCSKTNTTNCYGNTCAARIIKDGWKINY